MNNDKSVFDHFTPLEFANIVSGPEDERKETCIHCQEVWYGIHYKDGVCHSCQQKKLPGRSTGILKRGILAVLLLILAMILIVM